MTQAAGDVTAQDVREVVFPKPPVGRRGYDEKSVNDFLQLVARRLDGRGHLSADDVLSTTRAVRKRLVASDFPSRRFSSAVTTRHVSTSC